jgi:hypothetical protein
VIHSLGVSPERVILALSHTHSGPSLSLSDRERPGGELVPPYREHVKRALVDAAQAAAAAAEPCLLEWAARPSAGSRCCCCSLRGTPFLYHGDELGIADVEIPTDRQQDRLWVHPDTGVGRDGRRTPIAWTDEPAHGFSASSPPAWLPLHPDARERNVAAQRADDRSVLTLTQRLTTLRRNAPALREGAFEVICELPDTCLGYRRSAARQAMAVIANLGASTRTVAAVRGVFYCFARPTHEFLGFNAGRDFDREIVVKVNVGEVARGPRWTARASAPCRPRVARQNLGRAHP